MSFSSFGTVLKRGDGASPTELFTALAYVRDIKGPTRSLGTEDVTAHDSAAATFVATILDNGEVTFDIGYDPANTGHAGVISDMTGKTCRNWELVLTDTGAASYKFAAFVTKFELDLKVKGSITASLTLKISGAITITP